MKFTTVDYLENKAQELFVIIVNKWSTNQRFGNKTKIVFVVISWLGLSLMNIITQKGKIKDYRNFELAIS